MATYSAERFAPETAALIVVDVQNDFCHPDGVSARKGHDVSAAVEMVPRLETLIEEARAAGATVIFIQTTHDLTVDSRVWNTRMGDIDTPEYDPNCRTGTWGADFYVVAPKPGDLVVNKHRYSAFAGTDLDMVLTTAGVKTIVLTGVATNVCVESTLRDGLFLEYNVALVPDCSAAYEPELHEGTIRNVQGMFGAVLDSDELISRWSPIPAELTA
ncbi:cysteine hydrolase family protein [Salinibacterium hongtaonis]|uniref:Cysteine hydrolase n=1 Tax=Homoserinimonas hongtaonis TaxID=2079791 RepID=A0A2U1T1M5_9MICO|nr:cysteine hydrolase [Salinibacterium hongtaonis]AWB90350.1 cysteine hydrolase [Salinibacterium hongtaonis]PWB97779.1 cysteine hydrolase [Salinibacterium hongtaonis]